MSSDLYTGPWTFKYHPWLREMHDSQAPMNVGQKAAQMGYTETALNITFFTIDVKNTDVLYVLPSKTPDATEFTASRFDPALHASPHLSAIFSDVSNIGHKRAGNTNLYVRGSRSKGGLKSVPVGFVVIDELEECDQDNVPLAFERMAGHQTKMSWLMSTPHIDNMGINAYYQMSSQEEYFFRCPCCSRHTNLVFPNCLMITGDDYFDPGIKNSYIFCKECKGKLPHQTKYDWLSESNAKWVPGKSGREDVRGFYINQLYSFTKTPEELAKSKFLADKDPAHEQQYWNSSGGLPHIVDGAAVSEDQINACRKEYKNFEIKPYSRFPNVVTMGVDVGKWLHYEICSWHLPQYLVSNDLNMEAHPKVILQGKCLHFEELDKLMHYFGINYCIIDALPERRKATEFANRFHGYVRLCFYGSGIQSKQISIAKDSPEMTVDRTAWLDLSIGRFKNTSISLPLDVSLEYKTHIKSLVRIYEKNKDGQSVGKYVTAGEDHFAHARNYCELALPFAMSIASSQDIRSPT